MRQTILPAILLLLSFTIKAQIHDAELINFETIVTIKNGRLTNNKLFEIKINNRAGEKFTNITIPFSKLYKVSNIDAYIKDVNGNIVKKLSKKEIKDRSSISDISFYEDEFEKVFTLKHNTYPYTIIYSYQHTLSEFLYIENWHPVINPKVPTHKASLTLNLPLGYPIKQKSVYTDSYSCDTIDLAIKHCWTASYTNLFLNTETFAPPISQYLPSVVVVPQTFKFDLPGSFKSWAAYGNWQYELNRNLSDLSEIEKARINNMIKGMDDERDKIKRLYHNLQNETRYVNITIETGGMKPYPASYVATNKYGDCKALTNYFKAILHHIGISAFYTKVYAGDVIQETDITFPSQQFNHVILSVPLKNDTIWLDCTSKLPFGYLGTFTQNRDVMLVDNTNSHFVRTPAMTLADVQDSRTVKISQNNNNETIATFKNTYKGDEFESLYYIANYLSEQPRQQAIKKGYIETGFDVIEMNPIETWRDSTIARLGYTAKSTKVYNNYGKETLIKILAFNLPTLENPKDRKLPVQINYPIFKTDTLEYLLPNGKVITNQPTNIQIDDTFGRYSISFEQKDQKVIVIKNFMVYSGNYPKETYKPFFDFLNKIRDFENNAYIITQTP